MIDYGLLMSMIVGFGVPSLLIHRWPLSTFDVSGFFDAAIGPAAAGLVVGRLTALAIDDPNSIGSVSDMIIIRSGVEFWPGVLAAASVLAWGSYRAGLSPFAKITDLVPLALVGYGSYEASCVFRDGCFGPRSAIGLRPPGLTGTMLPIGWLMALAVIAGAVALRRYVDPAKSLLPIRALGAAGLVAVVRSVGSIWLPSVGEGLTRQHVSSIVVGFVALLILGGGFAVRGAPSRERALDSDAA